MTGSYAESIAKLGWKAFQDLCIAIVEQRLKRPVQTFLPTSDAGRDGAFLGNWDSLSGQESTIQCKFTHSPDSNLTLSMLTDEVPKAAALAAQGLAEDYIILTNHGVTGKSELAIKAAFQSAGVGRCRVYHRDWIIEQIQNSSELRMMMPRLYGMVDLATTLDQRAYEQARLILSEMADNLQKLVITDAYRESVRAISQFNLVLLLGSPAAGKSTIGASLALGASDRWQSSTIKVTSPEQLSRHIDPNTKQFFWIDDAWGSTQYQRERTEDWNKVFPLMQGAMRQGSRFLITSRDYIWEAARRELKIHALPVMGISQVIINVQKLKVDEKARILYNHIKLGDQPSAVKEILRPMLPGIARGQDFLPESARRLGTQLFTTSLPLHVQSVQDFCARPKEFLEQTITNLAAECRAAIALIFLNGGSIRSPVPNAMLVEPATTFGVEPALIRHQLEALNGSLLNLAEDEEGPYWTYHHPTVGDAFASHIAKSSELVELYLAGAKPSSIVNEVVCAGIQLEGAPVIVPNSLGDLLLTRISSLPKPSLSNFIINRANKLVSEKLLKIRPDILTDISSFTVPIKDDADVRLLAVINHYGLLPEERRLQFVESLRRAATEEGDDSFLEDKTIGSLIKDSEIKSILGEMSKVIINNIDNYVDQIKSSWSSDYDPDEYFGVLRNSLDNIHEALGDKIDKDDLENLFDCSIGRFVGEMREEYYRSIDTEWDHDWPISSSGTPSEEDTLSALFRDVSA
ncbi:hypothetical protein M2305_001832 [Gluconobacter cerinus]|uniref:nSTAND3 domain-containing NTPase n=1 Tax=Gluconobacter cerinus TaxID=38307 RepID=UPI0022262FC4|nr:hypothetical protein [Gluconobacter cerinus]MCW2265885.1 hypothetical protein [Gluconobacter cerinus]